MGAIFQSLGKTNAAAFAIVIIMIFGLGGAEKLAAYAWWAFVVRWLHVMSGVMWVGLLWYFNFVQTPSMPRIPDEQKPAIGKVIRGRTSSMKPHVSTDLSLAHGGTRSMPKYKNQASTLDPASRGVTVEANMSKANPRIGRDLMTHFQVADIPHLIPRPHYS